MRLLPNHYSLDQRIGWLNYFRMASMQAKLKELDGWLRNRLRYCIWEDWKKPERKRKNLIQLGVSINQAYAWSRTRMGGWAVAQSPIMITTITLQRLLKRGYEPLLAYYEKVAPQLNEPLYTRPVRTDFYDSCKQYVYSFSYNRLFFMHEKIRLINLLRTALIILILFFPSPTFLLK